MGKRFYMKLCKGCLMKFKSTSNGNCPSCGSDNWRYLDTEEREIPMITEDELERVIEGVPLANGGTMILCRRI